MNPVAKSLVVIGVALIVVGLIWQISSRFGPGLGKFPGDFAIEKPGFRFYFPLTTSLLISAAITIVMWLIRLFTNK